MGSTATTDSFGDGKKTSTLFTLHLKPCFTVLTLSDCPTAQQSKPRAKAKPNLACLPAACLHVTKSALLTRRISARFLWARGPEWDGVVVTQGHNWLAIVELDTVLSLKGED